MFARRLVIAIKLELVKDLSLFDDFFFKNKDITSLLSIFGNKAPFSFSSFEQLRVHLHFFNSIKVLTVILKYVKIRGCTLIFSKKGEKQYFSFKNLFRNRFKKRQKFDKVHLRAEYFKVAFCQVGHSCSWMCQKILELFC